MLDPRIIPFTMGRIQPLLTEKGRYDLNSMIVDYVKEQNIPENCMEAVAFSELEFHTAPDKFTLQDDIWVFMLIGIHPEKGIGASDVYLFNAKEIEVEEAVELIEKDLEENGNAKYTGEVNKEENGDV